MKTAEIIEQATADGVILALSPTGTIKATGNQSVMGIWLPTMRNNKTGILCAVRVKARIQARKGAGVVGESVSPCLWMRQNRSCYRGGRHSRLAYFRAVHTTTFLRWHDFVGVD